MFASTTCKILKACVQFPTLIGYPAKLILPFKNALVTANISDVITTTKKVPLAPFVFQHTPTSFYFRAIGKTELVHINLQESVDAYDDSIIQTCMVENATLTNLRVRKEHERVPLAAVLLEYAIAGEEKLWSNNFDAFSFNVKSVFNTQKWIGEKRCGNLCDMENLWMCRLNLSDAEVASFTLEDGVEAPLLSVASLEFTIEAAYCNFTKYKDLECLDLRIMGAKSVTEMNSIFSGVIMDNRQKSSEPASASHFWLAVHTPSTNFIVDSFQPAGEDCVLQTNARNEDRRNLSKDCEVPQQSQSMCGMASVINMLEMTTTIVGVEEVTVRHIEDACHHASSENTRGMYDLMAEIVHYFTVPQPLQFVKKVVQIHEAKKNADDMDLEVKHDNSSDNSSSGDEEDAKTESDMEIKMQMIVEEEFVAKNNQPLMKVLKNFNFKKAQMTSHSLGFKVF